MDTSKSPGSAPLPVSDLHAFPTAENLKHLACVLDPIRGDFRIIVELGARDGCESLRLAELFPKARVLSFECNPATLPLCRKAVALNPRVELIEKAVSDQIGQVTFYPTDPDRTHTPSPDGNPGASSLFKAQGDYPYETYVQSEVSVEATTLERELREREISRVDLLWMDIQGAELMALRGLGTYLETVQWIHTEVEFRPIYHGQPLFEDIRSFLELWGYEFLGFTCVHSYAGDALFVRKEANPFSVEQLAQLGEKGWLTRHIPEARPQVRAAGTHREPLRFAKDVLKRGLRRIQTERARFSSRQSASRGVLVLEIEHGGLGDHLFCTPIPRIAKQSERYHTVLISNRSLFRNPDYKRLIWELNPYVDGFTDAPGVPVRPFSSLPAGMNLLDHLMLAHGLDDGQRFHEPEIYYTPKPRPELADATLYDPCYVSYVGKLTPFSVEWYFRKRSVPITHQMRLMSKSLPVREFGEFLCTPTLSDFCDVLASAAQVYCLTSGTATLAAALKRPVIAFHGDGQLPMFHHSRLHRYVRLPERPPRADARTPGAGVEPAVAQAALAVEDIRSAIRGAGIVFSRDRALQLHALLTSYFEQVENPVPLHVIYSATTERHAAAYEEVFRIFAKHPVVALREEGPGSFRRILLETMRNLRAEKIFFLVDDLMFIEGVDMNDFLRFDTREYVPTLRMGEHLRRCYPVDRPQRLPRFQEQGDMLTWSWSEGEWDWAYPLSVDGHLFSRAEITPLIERTEFHAPNSLEGNLQKHAAVFNSRRGVSYRKARIVNVPCNKVQQEIANRHGAADANHPDELLRLWEEGYCIDLTSLYGITPESCHQELEFRYVRRD